MAKKLIRKELKRPDQFVGFWTRVSDSVTRFAATRKRALVIGLTAAATVIVGSIAISAISEARAQRAGAALDRVNRIAAGDLTTPGAPPKDDGIPHFATDKERLQGALAALDSAFGGSTPLRAEAMLVRAGLLLDLDRADEAETTYQQLLSDKLDPRLAFLAREGLGYTFERKGKLAEAKAEFSKLGDGSDGLDGFYKDRALYHQARLAELGGNPTEAQKIYQEVLEKNPTTSLRDDIMNRLAVLDVK